MKAADIISLKRSDKLTWLQRNHPEHIEQADDGELFGYIISLTENHWKDYIDYPEDYETGSLIKKVFTEMSSERVNNVNSGAAITKQEKGYLKKAVLKQLSEDSAEGENFLGCEFACDDGEVFVSFSSIHNGYPDISRWSFHNIYATREDAIKSVKQNLNENEYFFPM